MNERFTLSRPDFVIAAWPDGKGRFLVLGSDKLTEADLRVEYYTVLFNVRRGTKEVRDPVAVLQTVMKDYVIAEGDSYAEALANLFANWQPEPKPDPILPEWPKELPE